MNYYILDPTNNSLLFDIDKNKLQNTIIKFRPELINQKIQETDREIIELDGKFVFSDEHQEEIEQQKQQKESEEKELALQAAIEELGKEMAKADLAGDEEWKADLRAEYEALIMESEE